jgi:CHAD domain-containing protein
MDAKWIAGLTPEMPIDSAARLVLKARLDAVRYWLPLVAHAEKDIEFVHQLRVTTRRAGAALRLFRPCFSHSDYRQLRNLLRQMRRSAGDARDWDVFQESLFAESQQGSFYDFLFGFAASRRMIAQVTLSKMAFDLRRPLDQVVDDLEELIRQPPISDSINYGSLCQETVRSLMADFYVATHPIPPDYEGLHRLRILGKKIRYVFELGIDCFTPAVRESILPAIEQMQKILGHANDAHVASLRLQEIRFFVERFRPTEYPRIQTELESRLRACETELISERGRFEEWHRHWEEQQLRVELNVPAATGRSR